ncbi:MAG: hypothetical protein GY864_12085 [Desulfobacterales bacterium]|nr:hypothetical protein [Desulfobacterales bacterium]
MAPVPDILMVNNGPQTCQSLRELLRTQGYDVYTEEPAKDVSDIFPREPAKLPYQQAISDLRDHRILKHTKTQDPEPVVMIVSDHATQASVLGELDEGAYDNAAEEGDMGNSATYCMARDKSYTKSLEAQLVQAQKMESVGTLAAGLAHNFNNLLMGIQGNISMMLMKTDPEHPNHKRLTNIEQHIKHSAGLTKQLLRLARSQRHESKPIDLNKIIHTVAHMFGLAKKEIVIYEDCEEDIRPVVGDQGQIEEVLLNLLINAQQSMPGGGTIIFETKNVILDKDNAKSADLRPGPYVRISVTDNGVGIDEEIQEKIFEPFFTTKEMGKGTGLGLASAFRIIRNHKGNIDVYSRKGNGTTFNLYLPAKEE